MEYTVMRSKRRTLALEITPQLEIIVRAPRFMRDKDIQKFVDSHQTWLETHLEKQRVRQANRPPEPTPEEERMLRETAAKILPQKVAHYAAIMGVNPTGVRITSAKKRFGSCSGKNSLCFSWRLMAYPAEAIDYVVVHELAHIRHHDHSAAFYRFVASVMPDYKRRAALLKT